MNQYLKEIIAEEQLLCKEDDYDDLSLNVMALYHAYGIFGVLLNLINLKGRSSYDMIYDRSVATLLELNRKFFEGKNGEIPDN